MNGSTGDADEKAGGVNDVVTAIPSPSDFISSRLGSIPTVVVFASRVSLSVYLENLLLVEKLNTQGRI